MKKRYILSVIFLSGVLQAGKNPEPFAPGTPTGPRTISLSRFDRQCIKKTPTAQGAQLFYSTQNDIRRFHIRTGNNMYDIAHTDIDQRIHSDDISLVLGTHWIVINNLGNNQYKLDLEKKN